MAQVWNPNILMVSICYHFIKVHVSQLSFQIKSGWIRSFIADYGVPLMVLVWSTLPFIVPSKVPSGVPRMLYSPLPWESASLYHWTVIKV